MALRRFREHEEDERNQTASQDRPDERERDNPFAGGGPPSTRGGGGGTPQRGEPLGVPRGYVATVERRYSPNWQYPYVLTRPMQPGMARIRDYEQAPRYFDGMQYAPASEPVEDIIEKQRLMVIAGILDPSDGFMLGVWDPTTVDAYTTLLEYANQSGLTADQALRRWAESPGTMGGGAGRNGEGGGGDFTIDENGNIVPFEETFVPPPLEVRTTNKDDLRRVFRQAVINSLGRGWSDEQINELVEAYNWKEIAVQQEAYQHEVDIMERDFLGERTEGGETLVPSSAARDVFMPSPETYIEDEARRRDPAGFQATQIAEDYAPRFFEALAGFGL